MRQNRASRFNRSMMVGMMFMGIIVIGCVFFFLYWASGAQEAKQEMENSQSIGDSLVIISSMLDELNDSSDRAQ